jgi:phospholipid/cholesterol/gamma-HCH transport system substrate-binding protein
MRVKKSYPLHLDAKVEKATAGLLGSNMLELTPGDPGKAVLADGSEIVNVNWMSGMESLFASVGDLEGDLGSIVRNVNGITASINTFMGPDPTGQNPMPSFPTLVAELQGQLDALVADVTRTVQQVNGILGDNRENVSTVIANLTRVSEELKAIADGTGERGVAFNSMVANIADVTEQLRGVVSELRALIGASEVAGTAGGASQGSAGEQLAEARTQATGIRETVERLNESLDALSRVTSRIAEGEGTVGRLLTDDKLARDIEDAVEGAGEIVAGINRLDTHVQVLAWYNFNQATAHDGLSVRLQPRPDKYYLVELMNDPRRVPLYTWTTTTTSDPLHSPGGGTTTYMEEIARMSDDFRITAMFAKMWGPLTLRVGIIENSGGVGANLWFWEDRIRLRTDLYQFGYFGRLPRWRSYFELEPIEHVFLVGGVDDVLNAVDGNFAYNPDGWDYFAGAGIGFTDDDLKSLMTILPMP